MTDNVLLADYYMGEQGFVLLPIEHLATEGITSEYAALARDRLHWSPERIACFNAGFALYFERCVDLARRTPAWPLPRVRNVGIVTDATAVRPYVQILNTSTWLLYETDLDPAASNAEYIAYLLAHGDVLAATGEVTMAGLRSAAWWLERSAREREAFRAAAAAATRPDADAFRAIADGLEWLGKLFHRDLRPAPKGRKLREIPGTGLGVPLALEGEPPKLVDRTRQAAITSVTAYRKAWRRRDAAVVEHLARWLANEEPELVIVGEGGTLLWQYEQAGETLELRSVLAAADRVAVETIEGDLRTIARHTRAFLSALVKSDHLPPVPGDTGPGGYTYLHAGRKRIAYNLHEPGMERLAGPPLPYERAMLGARTAHEWGHLADEAGWVRASTPQAELDGLEQRLGDALEEVVAACPSGPRDRAAADLRALAGPGRAGDTLAKLLLARLPDYRANLVARHFMSPAERETYVRHNIRTLRYDYPRARMWRMLVRYLYEYQYLGEHLAMTSIADGYGYFVTSTGFAGDFFAHGILDERRFLELAEAVARICAVYRVDDSRIRLPAS